MSGHDVASEPADVEPQEVTATPVDAVAPQDVVAPLDTEPPTDVVVGEDVAAVHVPKEVRFAVLGDGGTGSDTQRKVAVALRDTCARKGCDFTVLLGDNIYDAGVESVIDAQWDSKFEVPYADVEMPFYAVLGNHDNGGFLTQWIGDIFGGAGAEFERGDFQVAYTQVSDKWRMPARHYDFRVGPAHFFALDSNDMVWSRGNDHAAGRAQFQMDTIPSKMDASDAIWKITLAHHPWTSNGKHGDAGAYEGLEEGITDLVTNIPGLGDLSDVVTGDGVLEAYDTIVCGRADLHFGGHEHNLQWFLPTNECPGTHFVVSGAAAKTTKLKRDDRTVFQHDATAGFFWVYLKDNAIEVEAISEDGTTLWSWQGFKD